MTKFEEFNEKIRTEPDHCILDCEIEVTERTKYTRKFQVHLGEQVFHVSVDKHGKVWIADKKVKSDCIYSIFPLGEAQSEIYADYWPFGFGLKSLWFKIENQTVYFERNHNQKAQRIEFVLKNGSLVFRVAPPTYRGYNR